MPKVVFIEHNGTEHTVEATVGQSIMQAAVANSVPGIEADCGGSLACGTCQGYIDSRWLGEFQEKSAGESAMLAVSSHLQSNSRLTCQLTLRAGMDGIIVRLPESQY
jgi:ferredoxin, 2Fe-2S